MSKQFIEHRPNYVTGFDNAVYDVKDFNEVLEIPFVKKFSESEKFHSYAVDVHADLSLPNDDPNRYRMSLLAMFDWDDEYNGCTVWWVVGQLPNFIMYETNLKSWDDVRAGHKPNCWTRKYNSCKELLGIDRDEESKMKILKELGWKKEDTYGIANTCDCGWDKKRR